MDHTTNRPFYSIIIPCYNTKESNLKLLLDSIIKQYMDDEIEVIISNDRSTDIAFLDVLKNYDNLNIKIVTVPENIDSSAPKISDYIHCPGNTREIGASNASGEWITFVDHDDELIPNTFKGIKDAILKEDEQYIASCNFYEINPHSGEIYNEFIHTGNWMHGKFYNLDHFWKAKDFHFPKNLKTHEDIYISSKTKCELYRLGKTCPFYIETFCLLWKAWPDSTSRINHNNVSFLELNFKDYIASTMDFYLNDYLHSVNISGDYSEENYHHYLTSCIDVLLYMYFYVQGFKFANPEGYLFENEMLMYEYKHILRNVFHIDNNYIYACTSRDRNGSWYNQVRQSAMIGVNPFIETESFYDFIFKH